MISMISLLIFPRFYLELPPKIQGLFWKFPRDFFINFSEIPSVINLSISPMFHLYISFDYYSTIFQVFSRDVFMDLFEFYFMNISWYSFGIPPVILLMISSRIPVRVSSETSSGILLGSIFGISPAIPPEIRPDSYIYSSQNSFGDSSRILSKIFPGIFLGISPDL